MVKSSMHMSQNTINDTSTINITNFASSTIKGTTESMILDGKFHDHKDYMWGPVRGRTGLVPTQDTRTNGDEEFFGKWALDTREGDCLLTESETVAGNWTSTMRFH
ncbi:hypothetical protein PENNAL_c0038G08025 [Penicillium nalgiovense]|uniref:Uncharacterized protein n=1 Tax=Penicillium nalgiovense TaxID=60175 RepID=A0A1V6Y3X2_PENNA|nr:hypothetical protein PENNAL_c0038G08025 [Penicillium nalgiovense]